jgi:hypothetical protein
MRRSQCPRPASIPVSVCRFSPADGTQQHEIITGYVFETLRVGSEYTLHRARRLGDGASDPAKDRNQESLSCPRPSPATCPPGLSLYKAVM